MSSDWTRPGATIYMAVTRKHATGSHRIGTLISLPGGPGTSGVDELRIQDRFSPALHESFDIDPLPTDPARSRSRPE